MQRSVARLRRDTAVTIRDPFFKDQWYLVSNYVTLMWYQTIARQKWFQKCVYSDKNEGGSIKKAVLSTSSIKDVAFTSTAVQALPDV